ncbi:MAG: hypothetical protein AB1Z98_37830, partial [Nannocystaceae bacterium]
MLACDPIAAQVPDAYRDGPACGNGVVEEGEACDLGFANAPEGRCRADCQAPRCGDGIGDEGEQCDDGNDDDRDACRRDCTRPLRSTWVRAPSGGELPAIIYDVVPTADGGVVAVGQGQATAGAAARGWVSEHAPDGELRWSQWLPADPTWASATARAVTLDADGDLWIAGYVGGERHDDLWVARCDPQGQPRWSTTEDYGGNRDRAVAIALHAQGVVVAAETLLDAENRDGLAIAFDAEGRRTWTYRHDGPAGGIDDARAIATTPDGGVLVGGGEDDLTGWWLAKLDAEGSLVGVSRDRGQVGAWVSAIAVDDAGDPWLAGTEVLDAPDPADPSSWHAQPWLARLDPSGRVRWRVVEPPTGLVRREAFDIALHPSGGAGTTHVTMVGTDPIELATCSRRFCPGRLWLASYDAQGQRRWWAAPEAMVRGEGRALAWGADGSLWLGGSRRLVFSEA